ncbi:MAG TPA: hypothetical protein VGB53_08600 [Rubricoccaceae bacterium]|jgi:hypothetical protein
MIRLSALALLAVCAVVAATVPAALAQRVPDPNPGNPQLTQWGIMDGNRVRTLYANHGEIARYPDQPSAEWPKGSGHSYIDGIAFVVSAATRNEAGQVIYPMSTNYREDIDRDPTTQVPWGWAPVPGYSNPRQASPARSDDDRTWPSVWPDRPLDWAGQWNGLFGRGVTNADVETYFVMDDANDPEWTLPPNRFFPCPGQPARGGLGLEVAVRGLQWNHPLAQDVIFWVYEITNECGQDYDDVVFAQYLDWGIGGTDDSGDDEGAYNTRLDLAFAYDADGIGSPGAFTPVGTAGYAFLESPGNSTDAVDNDEDGITNETRNSGPGTLIEGEAAIRAAVAARYDVARFETFYGSLDNTAAIRAGRWWTGDENLNWQQFTDLDGDGQFTTGEPLNDDVGEDGLGPQAANYPGRDIGEGDGRPTAGEPGFDALDKDESDQIGLTGFRIFNVHDFELEDDAQDYNIFREALPPIDVVLEGGRNLGMFFASGPFPLRAGQTERFSMALIFADKDFSDPRQIDNSSLARKKQTVQQIYNANYQFARPPDKPTLRATPGNGEVTLSWDARAEQSYDPFLREFDFEGYMIYRSTEPNFRENLLVTDAYGNPVYQRPLAQFDLANGNRGLHPVPVNGVQFNLGTDSGLRHSYVDRDVVNGQTYYYALVAYDRGLITRNPDGSFPTTPDGQVDGLSPSITTAVINNDLSGNVAVDINTAEVTPRAPAAGYVAPEVANYVADVHGTAAIELAIVAPTALRAEGRYRLQFVNPDPFDTNLTPTYELIDTATNTTIETGTIRPGLNELPLTDGFAITIDAPAEIVVPDTSVTFTAGDGGTYVPVVLPGTASPIVAPSRYVPFPYDFEIRWAPAGTTPQTSLSLAFGQIPVALPFEVYNTTLGRRQEVLLIEDNPDLRNQRWDPGDLIILVDGVTPGTTPTPGANWRAGWAIRLLPPDAGVPLRAPAPGAVLSFGPTKPFATGDYVEFAFTAPGFDAETARAGLGEVYVVPNPYVATSLFEAANPYLVGRGEREIVFMGLPPQCTIRIYTVTGDLVQTLTHDSTVDDGQEPWNLVSRDGMDVAYGVYLFHVDAPGVGTSVGRFALIK